MGSLIKRPGFSDRFSRDAKRFALGFADEPRFLQSAELNELQSMSDDKLARVASYILQDGRKMVGPDPVVSEIAGDDQHISVRLPASSVYVGGFVHDVPEAVFTLPLSGSVTIGVRITEALEDEVSDPLLRGQIAGTEAFQEPGAIRVRLSAAWGHSLEVGGDPLVSVFDMRDGTILTNDTNIDFSEIYRAISNYSRESNGSFVNAGCAVTALGLDDDGNQIFTVGEGVAYVNGTRLPRTRSMRFAAAEEPDLRDVSSEPHAWTAATDGTQTITLAKAPVASITQVTIVREVTETVTHGGFSGVADDLAHPSVAVPIIEVRQGGTVYTTPADWLLSNGALDWSPAGAEPAPGSTYTVHYHYYENVQPDAVTRDSITVTGGANGTNVLVSYAYKLPRLDAVALTPTGEAIYIKGVAAISRPQPPTIPSTYLELARVENLWGIKPNVTQTAIRNVPYSEITNMRDALLDLYDLVAQERLKTDISSREVAAKKGVFVDPFLDDDLRDQGIAQTAASYGGRLRLPITSTVHEFPAFLGVALLDFTDEAIISQLRESGLMKINPYQTFTPMPGRASLEPSTDIWTEKESVWASPETAKFDPPDTGANGNNNTITSVSLDTNIAFVRSQNVEAEFVRQRPVNFRLEGFIEGEGLQEATFDGIHVDGTNSGPADADGVITGSFTIPANVPEGSKAVVFVGGSGTVATTTYIARGTITVEEYRLSTALNGTVEELPEPVTEVTQVINQTTVQNITNVTNVTRVNSGWTQVSGGGGGPSSQGHTSGRSDSGSDPLAQTFTLTEGRCITAVRLKCSAKGSASNAIFVQLRTTKVGLPTTEVLAEAFVPGTDLVPGEFFTARFGVPVYLERGVEYAFVVLTDDADHALAIAELGKIDQTGAIISEQPFVVGVLLSSSNASTWTVHNDRDLTFQLIAASFAPDEKTVPIGSFTATKMSDIIVSAGVSYPENSVSVELDMTRPNGEVITAAPGQRFQLDDYIENETIQLAARLTGNKRVTPFLFSGVQIIEGELQASGDYVTRAMEADGAARVSTTIETFLPSGSTIKVEIGEPDGWIVENVSAATPLGDGVIEQRYERTPYAELDARTRITLTGTPAARPYVQNLRMVSTEV